MLSYIVTFILDIHELAVLMPNAKLCQIHPRLNYYFELLWLTKYQ